MSKSKSGFKEPNLRRVHFIAAALFFIPWLTCFGFCNCDLSFILLHPVDDFDLYAPVLFLSILTAWVHRDVKSAKDLNLKKFEEIVTSHKEGNIFTDRSTSDVLNELQTGINRSRKADSILYFFSLLGGAYTTLCVAKAIIER